MAPTRCALRWRAARPGTRHQVVLPARRDQPQFRNQVVERLPLRRNERLRNALRLRSGEIAGEALNRWIAHETFQAAREVTEALRAYRFNDAANAIYRFVWNVYCDWYLELAKPVLLGEEGPAKAETRAMVAWARDEILKLLHPFMPFITEELWMVTARRDGLLALAPWSIKPGALPLDLSLTTKDDLQTPPELLVYAANFVDHSAEGEIGWLIDLVTAIRSVRAEMKHSARDVDLAGAGRRVRRDPRTRAALERRHQADGAAIRHLLRRPRAPRRGAASGARRGRGPSAQGRDRSRRRTGAARQGNRQGRRRHQAGGYQARNEKFVANAPEDIVEEEKKSARAAVARKEKILEALERLKNAV